MPNWLILYKIHWLINFKPILVKNLTYLSSLIFQPPNSNELDEKGLAFKAATAIF